MVAAEKKFHDIFPKPTSLSETRQRAFSALENLSIPNTKHEEWKYTNLNKLLKESFVNSTPTPKKDLEEYFLPTLQDTYRLVFLNGSLQEKYTILPQHIEFINFLEAEKQLKIKEYFSKTLEIEKDYFNALNTAFAQQGYFLRLPNKAVLEKPLLIYNFNSGENTAFLQRNIIIAETSSQAQIIHLHFALSETPAFVSEITEVFLQENAQLAYYKIQNEKGKTYRIDTTQVEQQNYSHFKSYFFSVAGQLVRNNLNILIDGEYCETVMYGLSFLKNNDHVDHHTLADHRKPNSYSNELYKGIFADSATGVFNGKIYVRQQAQKTNAYQQNRNILLSEQASVYTKPQLEIWADDVKCSHGATTGKLDETALFYMRSRGISENTARKLLLKAFAQEIIEKVSLEPLQNYLAELIE